MIETERLILRGWRGEDAAEFLRVTNTPAVMAHLGGVQADPEGIQGTIERQRRYEAEHGHCLWIAERKSDGALLGFCGLQPGNVGAVAGEIEIGWRLREDGWARAMRARRRRRASPGGGRTSPRRASWRSRFRPIARAGA